MPPIKRPGPRRPLRAARIGFTGTRKGMTQAQYRDLGALVQQTGATEAHHGDCVGADAMFHRICLELQIPIVIHPPVNEKARAFCKGGILRTEPPLPYLERNRNIVAASQLLFATPAEDTEPSPMRGQGTWSTIRYARRTKMPIRIVWPEPDTSVRILGAS